MKNLFSDLDLYKIIILLSLVLIPVVGFWAYSLEGQLQEASRAISQAKKPGGTLEQIGQYQKAVEEQQRHQTKQGSATNPELYFDQQIRKASSGEGGVALSRSDFQITQKPDQSARRNKAVDSLVSITWKKGGREQFSLSRDFILAVLFNCESQAPIWKLRELRMQNEEATGRGKVPPPEFQDKWKVSTMTFARRRPKRAN